MIGQLRDRIPHALDRLLADHPADGFHAVALRMVRRHRRHPWLPQEPQRLVHDRPAQESCGLPPVIAIPMLIEIQDRLLEHILGRCPRPNDRTGDGQQPAGMKAHRLLKQLGGVAIHVADLFLHA